MRQQTNTAGVISEHLKQTVWKNRYFSIDCKTKIYKICLRLAMTYGAETRAETSISKRLLRTNEMKIIRSITGHSLRERKRSTEIREQCKVNYIVCRRMTEIVKDQTRDKILCCKSKRRMKTYHEEDPSGMTRGIVLTWSVRLPDLLPAELIWDMLRRPKPFLPILQMS
jgi:hypothetical protein